MFFVYAISSLSRNYIYVGLTNNPGRRFEQHQSGQNKTTKPYGPFVLFHQEEYPSRIKARTREKFFKTGEEKELLKQLLHKIVK